MINALEAIIQFLKAGNLSTDQIASKGHFGDGWAAASKGVIVRLDGGSPDIYTPVVTPRLEIRCYGADDLEAMQLAMEVGARLKSANRTLQMTRSGTAMIYWALPETEVSLQWDDTTNQDFALMFYGCAISEQSIE